MTEQTALFTPHSFTFSSPEREAFRKRADEPVKEWAKKNLRVSFGGRPGPFRPEFVPYHGASKGPFDAYDAPWVRRIHLAFPPQTAKSLFGHVCQAHKSHTRPSSSFTILADQTAASNFSRDYVQPLYMGSPQLAALMPSDRDDKGQKRIRLKNGHTIWFAWASSLKTIQSFPAELVVGDEVKDWPTGAEEVAESRTRQYPHTSKIIFISSIRDEKGHWDNLHTALDLRFHHARCPACGDLQVLVWGGQGEHGEDGHDEDYPGVKFPSREEPDTIESDQLARYRCAGCRALWDETTLNQAVNLGEWVSVKKSALEYENWDDPHPPRLENPPERPISVAFFLPASWYSQEVSMSKAASSFLRAVREEDPVARVEKLKIWTNEHRNRPWIERPKPGFDADSLLERLSDGRAPEIVPTDALCLVSMADVQEDSIWYEIRAVLDPVSLTSALVAYGHLPRGVWIADDTEGMAPDFRALRDILDKPYRSLEGEEHLVALSLVDSGYRTSEVYDFCRRRGNGSFPTKGEDVMAKPLEYRKIDTMPGSTTLIPGGLTLIRLNTWHFKNDVALRLSLSQATPGAWILSAQADATYTRHYTSEYPDRAERKWLQRGRQPNHLWDCGVGCRAAMEILRSQGVLARIAGSKTQNTAPAPHIAPQKSKIQQKGGGLW